MYQNIFFIGNIVFYVLIGFCFLLLIKKFIYHFMGLLPSKKFPDAKKDHKYVILIPARNESAVIEDLLKSIKKQKYDQSLLKTYVIVESQDDPTCEIVKNYENTEIFVRKKLDLKGKGYALDECMAEILQRGEEYDACFIFDADNVLAEKYIYEMNKAYDSGNKICLGYRNSKNWNGGWIASCSALTFSMVNTFHNKCRSRFNVNVLLSGTGFYIDYSILKNMGGWKFFSLTEDYELSVYSSIKNIKSTYNEYAEFFDEQPTDLKTSWNQRIRWVKGHGETYKKYSKGLFKSILTDKKNSMSKMEYLLSIFPIVFILIATFGYSIFMLIMGIIGSVKGDPLRVEAYINFAVTIASLYLFFVLYGIMMLSTEWKHINISAKNAVICCLMMPIYFGLYIPIFFATLFKKKVEWKPIKHTVTMEEDFKKNN